MNMLMQIMQGKNPQQMILNYLQQSQLDLSADITEMVRKASPEEKQMLQKKIQGIAAKINV